MKRQFPTEAQPLEAEYPALPPGDPLAAFVPDIPLVIGALLRGPYPVFGKDASLLDVLNFPPDQQEQAAGDERRLLDGLPPKNDDVRTLFASARLATRVPRRSTSKRACRIAC
jgi:hypothetical protein